MKKIILALILLFCLQSKAQSPVIDIPNWNGKTSPPYFYLKDLSHNLDPYVGTWLYTNGTTSLRIVLQIKEQVLRGNYYEDILIGEFQYISNGAELFNSLADLNAYLPSPYYHNIHGNYMPTTYSPFDVVSPIRRIHTFMKDNTGNTLEIQKTSVNGQDAIEILKLTAQAPTVEGQPIYDPVVPCGFYTLVKQP